jgi:hypothetical protein
MPRKSTYARNPAPRPEDKPDTGAAAVQTIVQRSAYGAPALALTTTAVPSVFHQAVAPTKRTKSPPIDPFAVVIVKGRAVPPQNVSRSAGSAYAELFARMGAGDMVELPRKVALNFFAWSKKQKKKLVLRKLNAATTGVWREA